VPVLEVPAPAPPRTVVPFWPKIVVDPVVVAKVEPPEVTSEVRAEVVIAEVSPALALAAAKMVVEPTVVSLVEPSEVTVLTIAEVVIADEEAAATLEVSAPDVEAADPVEVVEPEPAVTASQYASPALRLGCLSASGQDSLMQSRIPKPKSALLQRQLASPAAHPSSPALPIMLVMQYWPQPGTV